MVCRLKGLVEIEKPKMADAAAPARPPKPKRARLALGYTPGLGLLLLALQNLLGKLGVVGIGHLGGLRGAGLKAQLYQYRKVV